jgi:hypothetical protein
MADVGRGDEAVAGGVVGQFPLEQWFFEMPFCTRWWTTAVGLTSILVQCRVISPFNLFFSTNAIFNKGQVSFTPLSTERNLLNREPVLATHLILLLLWSTRSRPALPRILPPTIFAPPRRILGSIPGALLIPPRLLRPVAPHPLASIPHLLPWLRA